MCFNLPLPINNTKETVISSVFRFVSAQNEHHHFTSECNRRFIERCIKVLRPAVPCSSTNGLGLPSGTFLGYAKTFTVFHPRAHHNDHTSTSDGNTRRWTKICDGKREKTFSKTRERACLRSTLNLDRSWRWN